MDQKTAEKTSEKTSEKTKKPVFEIVIQWGEGPEYMEEAYGFDTQAELRAFRMGIQEADGWFGYEIIYTDEELEHE